MLIFWKLLPKSIKKSVEKLYNKMAGNFHENQELLSKLINRWKKPKE